jgi:hypothetical protein
MALALPLAGIGSFQALFAPGKELWPRWQAHDPGSRETIGHGEWDALLQKYLSPGPAGASRFAYGRVDDADGARLDAYIARLSKLPISRYRRDEQRAFWLNLYNALTVDVVLRHYPVASIRDIDISPGLFADGPWDKALLEVEGTPLTLNDIEHRILRPIWDDPRLHYALNCAAVGCPDLQARAFTAANAEALLDAAARSYINSTRGVSIRAGRVQVSSIYAWFQEDFGGSDAGIIAHLKRYAAPELRAALDRIDRLRDHDYDWALNDAGRP